MIRVFKHEHLQVFGLKLNKYEYFYPLKVLGRGSETFRVGQKLDKIA